MNIFLRIGTTIVFLALASYSVGINLEQRKKIVTQKVLAFLTAGVTADIIATTFMIIGTGKGIFKFHGIIGLSALGAMLANAILMWRAKRKNGLNSKVPELLHLFSLLAFIWWIFAFITGLVRLALI